MTDENTQSEQNAETASRPAGASSPTAKKPRSSSERLMVWGVIGVLLLVAAVEAHAKFSYDATLTSLENVFENDDKGEVVSYADLDGLLKGFETRSEITKQGSSYVVECQWKSMFHDFVINILVTDQDPQKAVLISYSTPDAERVPVIIEAPTSDDPDGDGYSDSAEDLTSEAEANRSGRRGSRRQRGIMGQLADEAVQAELKLTDEQKSKIEELGQGPRPDFSQIREMSSEERSAFFEDLRQKSEAGIKGILSEEQFARVRQLTLRAAGLSSLSQSDVQTDLKLTDEQKETLSKLIAEQSTARRSLGREGTPEQRQKRLDGWNAKITSVLTDEQKEAWEKLLGPAAVKTETTAATEE
jgi:Spy/CpxP family protein refolding chaperone